MPIAVQPKTLADLREAVRVRAKLDSTDTETLAAVDGFLNQRYLSVATESGWRWLRAKRDLRIPAAYSTGTVAVTTDSRNVVGSSTVWTADMVGSFIQIEGDVHTYQIVAWLSATSIQLSERILRTTDSGLTYSIFKSEFGMWPDMENIAEVWSEAAGNRLPLVAISPTEYWDAVAQSPSDTGVPRAYARDGFKSYEGVPIGQIVVGYDFIGAPESFKLAILPRIPTAKTNLHVSYFLKATPMAADTDEPLLPLEDRWVLIYGALADLYGTLGSETSMAYWNNEFEKGIKRMLRDNNKTDAKATLVVPDKWRRRGKKPSAARYDLGTYFDKYY